MANEPSNTPPANPPANPGSGDGAPAPANTPPGNSPNAPTSAQQAADAKSAREIALEKRVSTLEDEKNTITGQLKEATEWIKKQTSTPTPAPATSLSDEVNEFLGCGLS